jgi:hypothetical protein
MAHRRHKRQQYQSINQPMNERATRSAGYLCCSVSAPLHSNSIQTTPQLHAMGQYIYRMMPFPFQMLDAVGTNPPISNPPRYRGPPWRQYALFIAIEDRMAESSALSGVLADSVQSDSAVLPPDPSLSTSLIPHGDDEDVKRGSGREEEQRAASQSTQSNSESSLASSLLHTTLSHPSVKGLGEECVFKVHSLFGASLPSTHPDSDDIDTTIPTHEVVMPLLHRVRVWPHHTGFTVSNSRRSQGIRNVNAIVSDQCRCHNAPTEGSDDGAGGDDQMWLVTSLPPLSDDSAALSAIRITLFDSCKLKECEESGVDSWADHLDHVQRSNLFSSSSLSSSSPSTRSFLSKCVISDEVIHFKKQITALTVHRGTATRNSVDLLLGFASGDILYYHYRPPRVQKPQLQESPKNKSVNGSRTVQLNKTHKIGSGSVAMLSWVPLPVIQSLQHRHRPLCFLVSFSRPAGVVFLLDIDRLDPQEPITLSTTSNSHQFGQSVSSSSAVAGARLSPVQDANPVALFNVCIPSAVVSCDPMLTCISSSSSGAQFLFALTCRDFTLRILHLSLEWSGMKTRGDVINRGDNSNTARAPPTLVQFTMAAFSELAQTRSVYGCFLSVCSISYDRTQNQKDEFVAETSQTEQQRGSRSLYIATGGEDDTVSLWKLSEQHSNSEDVGLNNPSWVLSGVARGKGHSSFVSAVQFYRHPSGLLQLISAGQDCCCILWDILPNDKLHLASKFNVGPSPLCSLQVFPTLQCMFISSLQGFMHFLAWIGDYPRVGDLSQRPVQTHHT